MHHPIALFKTNQGGCIVIINLYLVDVMQDWSEMPVSQRLTARYSKVDFAALTVAAAVLPDIFLHPAVSSAPQVYDAIILERKTRHPQRR